MTGGGAFGAAAVAPCIRAASKRADKILRRFAARRSIPAHAAELKKYFSGIGPSTRTRDKDKTLAPLGHAEILGIKNPPRGCSFGSSNPTRTGPFWYMNPTLSVPTPKFRTLTQPRSRAWNNCVNNTNQGGQDCSESVPCITEHTGHVFPHKGLWVAFICHPRVIVKQGAAFSGQPGPQAGDAEILTGRAPYEDIDTVEGARVELSYIAQVRRRASLVPGELGVYPCHSN
jgi:hypothetical protein